MNTEATYKKTTFFTKKIYKLVIFNYIYYMFSPKQLSKISDEAIITIENQRRFQIEHQEKLAEVSKIKETELLIKIRKLEKIKEEVVKAAIKAALIGDKKTQIIVPSSLTDDLKNYFINNRISIVTQDAEVVYSRMKSKLNNLINKLAKSSSLDVDYYKNKLLIIESADEDDYFAIKRVIDEMNEESVGVYDEEILYFNNQIKPIYKEIKKIELLKSDENIEIELVWKLKDMLHYKFASIEDAPSWLLSTSGFGLIQNINSCLIQVAKSGVKKASFDLIKIPQQIERWGANEMTKVIFSGTPIGIFPFKSQVFSRILRSAGFDIKLNFNDSVQTLSIVW